MTSSGEKITAVMINLNHKQQYEWTTVPNPLLIDCVLSNLFQYMTFKDHKSMRFVHSTWNGEAVNRMKESAVVSIGCSKYQDDPKNDDYAYDFTNIPKYINVMQDFPVEAIRLNLYHEDFNPDFYSNFEKTSEIITAFIENFHFNFKFLDLKIFLKTAKDFLRFQRIISAKSVRNINHLVLKLNIAKNTKESWKDIQINDQLKNVQKLEIFGCNNDNEIENNAELCSVVSEKMLKFLPNIKTVVFKPPYFSESSVNHRKTFQSYEFIKQFLHKLKTHAQLREISLPLKLREGISERDLRKLLEPSLQHISSTEFLGNLTHLEIPLPHLSSTELIQNLFDRHASTLQEFTFVVPTCVRAIGDIWRPRRKEIQMPVFPNLRKLNVQHQQHKAVLEFGNKYVFIIKFLFAKGNMDYARYFPKLKDLTLGNPEESATKNIWVYYKQFVPTNCLGDINVFENLKVIKLPQVDTNEYYFPSFSKDDDSVLGIMAHLKKCFPNAENPDLMAATKRFHKLRSWSNANNKFKRQRFV